MRKQLRTADFLKQSIGLPNIKVKGVDNYAMAVYRGVTFSDYCSVIVTFSDKSSYVKDVLLDYFDAQMKDCIKEINSCLKEYRNEHNSKA